jgi:predicted nucleic acid-binding Zn ribbon protein
MTASEGQEVSRTSQNLAPLRRPGNRYSPPAAKLEQSLVAELTQRAQRRIGVDADDRGQVLGWREPLARLRLTIRDGTTDLGRHLFVQLHVLVPLYLDFQHGASHTSVIFPGSKLPTSSPTTSTDRAELEALMEEARRRARRRRLTYLAALIVVALIGVGIWLAVRGGDAAPSGSQGPPGAATRGAAQSGVVNGTVDMAIVPSFRFKALSSHVLNRAPAIQFQGPFVADAPGRLPEFNLAFTMRDPREDPIRFSLIATSDSGYLVFDGRAYQVKPARFARLSSAPALAGVDPATWVRGRGRGGAGNSGRTSGRLDAGRMVSDVTQAVERLGIDPGRTIVTPSLFHESEIHLATARSGQLKRLAIALEWEGRSEEMGRFAAAMHARLRITEFNRPQAIEPPSDAVPLTPEVTRELPPELWGLVEFLSTP